MLRTLSQQEIDSIVERARKQSQTTEAPAAEIAVRTWDASDAGRLSKDHARTLSTMHEAFARNLTHTLGAYLRTSFGVTMISVEQYSFDDLLGAVPEATFNIALQMEPFGSRVLLQLDHSIVFPVVDVLLGGTGDGRQPERAISEIENFIIGGVCKIIGAELQSVWTPLGCTFTLGDTQAMAKLQRAIPGAERLIVLSFEISILTKKGTLNLVLPLSAVNSILRKTAHDWTHRQLRSDPASADRLRSKVLRSKFRIELCSPHVAISLRELLALEPGAVLSLKIPITTPAELTIDSLPIFRASPVRSGSHRAAELQGTTESLPYATDGSAATDKEYQRA